MTPTSFDEKENVALFWLTTPFGPAVMAVSGGVASTVQLRVAGDPSTLPAWSLARTASECGPSARLLNVTGFAHATKAPPSRLHSYVTGFSSEEKLNVALDEFTSPLGPATMLVPGAMVSRSVCVLFERAVLGVS